MKVKVIQPQHTSLLEERVDDLMINVNVTNIKFAHILERNTDKKFTALTMYEG